MTSISYLDDRRTPAEIMRIAGRFVDRHCEAVEGHLAFFRQRSVAKQATEARERIELPADCEPEHAA